MKRIRSFAAAALAILICLSLAACTNSNDKSSSSSTSSGTSSFTSSDSELTTSSSQSSSRPESGSMDEDESSASESTKPSNTVADKTAMSTDFLEIGALDSSLVQWGPGLRFLEDGRPEACVYLQQQYGKYDADFLREGDEHKGRVYLTFDEGYENGYTGKILDTLKEKKVPAVFFVTQPYAEGQPELIRRMIDEGHVIGNHSVHHLDMSTLSLEEQYDEVAGLHRYMEEEYGYGMYLWRFPTGTFSVQNIALLQKMGYRSVFWSFAYADWDVNAQPDPAAAKTKITGSLHDGEIFLLHAVSSTNTAVLGDVIDYVRAQGYEFAKYEENA